MTILKQAKETVPRTIMVGARATLHLFTYGMRTGLHLMFAQPPAQMAIESARIDAMNLSLRTSRHGRE